MYPVWLLFFHATIIHHPSQPFHLFIHYTTLIHSHSLPKNHSPLWYNKTMNEASKELSRQNKMLRKANREIDKENDELKKRVKELEAENKRLDESVRALKDELFKLMVENGELKRRN